METDSFGYDRLEIRRTVEPTNNRKKPKVDKIENSILLLLICVTVIVFIAGGTFFVELYLSIHAYNKKFENINKYEVCVYRRYDDSIKQIQIYIKNRHKDDHTQYELMIYHLESRRNEIILDSMKSFLKYDEDAPKWK